MRTKTPFGAHNVNRPSLRRYNTGSGIENEFRREESSPNRHPTNITLTGDDSQTSSAISSMTLSPSSSRHHLSKHRQSFGSSNLRRNSITGGKPPLPPTSKAGGAGAGAGAGVVKKSKRRRKKKNRATTTSVTTINAEQRKDLPSTANTTTLPNNNAKNKTTPHSSITPKISNRYGTAVAPMTTTDSLLNSALEYKNKFKKNSKLRGASSKQPKLSTIQEPTKSSTMTTTTATTSTAVTTNTTTNAAAAYLLTERLKTKENGTTEKALPSSMTNSSTEKTPLKPSESQDACLFAPQLPKISMSSTLLVANQLVAFKNSPALQATPMNVNNSSHDNIDTGAVEKGEETRDSDDIDDSSDAIDCSPAMDCDSDDESLGIEQENKPTPPKPPSKVSSLQRSRSVQDSIPNNDTGEGWVLQHPTITGTSRVEKSTVPIVDNEEYEEDITMGDAKNSSHPTPCKPPDNVHDQRPSLTPSPPPRRQLLQDQNPVISNNSYSAIETPILPPAPTAKSESTSSKMVTKGMIQRARTGKVDNSAVISAMLSSGPDRGSVIHKQRRRDHDPSELVGTTLEVTAAENGDGGIDDDASELTALTMEDLKYNKPTRTITTSTSTSTKLETTTEAFPSLAKSTAQHRDTKPRTPKTPARKSLFTPTIPSLQKVLSAKKGGANRSNTFKNSATASRISGYIRASRASAAIRRNARTLTSSSVRQLLPESTKMYASDPKQHQSPSTTDHTTRAVPLQENITTKTKRIPLPISSLVSNPEIKQELTSEKYKEQNSATDSSSMTSRQLFEDAVPKSNHQSMWTSSTKRTSASSYTRFQEESNKQTPASQVRHPNNTLTVFNHPPLPPGWIIKVSKTKNRVFYCHPDFGSTWHCPVVLPDTLPILPSLMPDTSIERSSSVQTYYTHSQTQSSNDSNTNVANAHSIPSQHSAQTSTNDISGLEEADQLAQDLGKKEESVAVADYHSVDHDSHPLNHDGSAGESSVVSDGTIHNSDSAVIVDIQHGESSDKRTTRNIVDREVGSSTSIELSEQHEEEFPNEHTTADRIAGSGANEREEDISIDDASRSSDILEEEIAVSSFAHGGKTINSRYKTSYTDEQHDIDDKLDTENKGCPDVDLIETNNDDVVSDSVQKKEYGREDYLVSHHAGKLERENVITSERNTENSKKRSELGDEEIDNLDLSEIDMGEDVSAEDDNILVDEGFDGDAQSETYESESANDNLNDTRHSSADAENDSASVSSCASSAIGLWSSSHTANQRYASKTRGEYSPGSIDSGTSTSIQSTGRMSRSTVESLFSLRMAKPPHPPCCLQNIEALFKATSLTAKPKHNRKQKKSYSKSVKKRPRCDQKEAVTVEPDLPTKVPDPIRRRLVYESSYIDTM